MKPIEYTAEEQAFIDAHPFVCPTRDMGDWAPIDGVFKCEKPLHVGVKIGAIHKTGFVKPIHSADFERVGGHDWELFTVQFFGVGGDGIYVWGSFVEGLGMFHVMVPVENIRPLLLQERKAWSTKVLGMYGSHTGKLSRTMASGVAAEV